MSLIRRLRGTSLLARFGATSLVLTIAVGALLSSVLSRAIAERAREQAEWTVIVTVRLGLQPELTPADLVQGFDPQRLAGVEQTLHSAAHNLQANGVGLDALDPVELKIFNRDRTV